MSIERARFQSRSSHLIKRESVAHTGLCQDTKSVAELACAQRNGVLGFFNDSLNYWELLVSRETGRVPCQD